MLYNLSLVCFAFLLAFQLYLKRYYCLIHPQLNSFFEKYLFTPFMYSCLFGKLCFLFATFQALQELTSSIEYTLLLLRFCISFLKIIRVLFIELLSSYPQIYKCSDFYMNFNNLVFNLNHSLSIVLLDLKFGFILA